MVSCIGVGEAAGSLCSNFKRGVSLSNRQKFYINGEWVQPTTTETLDVINPATEQPIEAVAMGGAEDVNKAVAAAKKAFETFSQTTKEERIALLEAVIAKYAERMSDIAAVISEEMGAPAGLAAKAQAPTGIGHLMTAVNVLKDFEFEEDMGTTRVIREPAGVCGFITPWNWPINQIACKVAPALAAGCTMVLKPSEVAPFNAIMFAEVLDEAGVPPGVFNLVNGDGPTVGATLSAHPDVDMMSFTGSTRAGVEVAKAAAPTVKRLLRNLAANQPISFWMTRTSLKRFPVMFLVWSRIRVKAVTRPPACWCRMPVWTRRQPLPRPQRSK